MRIRSIATAFLENDGDLLLMKRSQDRKLAPGYWFGVGGHFEEGEHAHPVRACLREIEEETGLKSQDLVHLRLRCLVMRHHQDELVLNYIFTGTACTRNVEEGSEGSLHWVNPSEIRHLLFADVIRLILLHLIPDQMDDPFSWEAGDAAAASIPDGVRADDREDFEIGIMIDSGTPEIHWQKPTCWSSPF